MIQAPLPPAAPLRIIRRSGETGGMLPEPIAALSAQYASPFHHEAHQVRHPAGVYNVSLGRVLERFETAMKHRLQTVNARPAREAPPATKPPWMRDFLDAYEQLLYSLAEHIEDCYTILKSCLPPGAFKTHPTRKTYLEATAEYRDRTNRIVNHIKHAHGRLRLIVFEHGEVCTLGYYVEGVGADGAVGPATKAHGNANTFLDVGLDLRFHFAHLYALGHHLSRGVEAILGEGTDSEVDSRWGERVAAIAQELRTLPICMDPTHLPTLGAHVQLVKSGSESAVVVAYPVPLVGDSLVQQRTRVQIHMEGDGTTRSFAFPHFD